MVCDVTSPLCFPLSWGIEPELLWATERKPMRLPLRKRPARLLVGTGFELYDWWGFLARSLAGVINRKT